MSDSKIIWLGASIGSIAGGYIPSMLGAGIFSFWSVIGGGVGGLAGIWAAYKLTH